MPDELLTPQAAGRLGGAKTAERLKDDPDYYGRIGRKGGAKTAQRLAVDPEYYQRIGRRGGHAKAKRRRETASE